MQASVEMSDCKSAQGQLTTCWSGPRIQRQIQEMIRMRVQGRALEETIPGRSARSRYAARSGPRSAYARI